ncbi:MAG: peptide chain release factor N(5)-glutamine methyltransferase [Micropepsaceae bacterium]
MTLQEAASRLAAAGIEDPMREARILFNAVPDRFDDAVARRAKHEPTAYILGRREFWSLDFEVTPAVLIPRPDSETLVEAALKELKHEPPKRILDLGTGSGCLIVSLLTEWRAATAIAVDISADALAVAERNAARHAVSARIDFRQNDWAANIDERFDLVISNPPYISNAAFVALDADVRDFEPETALKAGPKGLDAIERIAQDLNALLKPKALALVEIGFDQGASAAAVFTNAGLEIVRLAKDLAGHDRVVVARLPQNDPS